MSRNSTLLSNNNVQEMDANYLNMEGGAWKSSQVGGATVGFPPKGTEGFTIDGVQVPGKAKTGSTSVKYGTALELAKKIAEAKSGADNDTPYYAPKPDSNSTGDFTSSAGTDIADYRDSLKKMNPAKVALANTDKVAIDKATGKVVLLTAFAKRAASDGVSQTDQMIADYAQFAKTTQDAESKVWSIDVAKTERAYSGFNNLKKPVDLQFLPDGGVGDYANHLPSSEFISGLPGALAIANFQPLRLMPPVMAHSLVAQRGGGAMVYSNAPSVRKYCGDGNFLAQRISSLQASLKSNNISLTGKSTKKVEKMLAVLKAVEGSLCVAYDKMDALLANKGEDKEYDLDDINASLSELKAKKRKLSGQALSTIMTLEDVMYKAASKALKDNKTENTGQPGEQQAIQQ